MTTRTVTPHAAAAKAIRRDLKAAYPTVTFSVVSERFSGGNAVDIIWTDGPTSAAVEQIVKKYQYGHFDGMIDLYEHSNRRDDIPQVKFVQTRRDRGTAATAQIVEKINRLYRVNLVLTIDGDRAYIDRSKDVAIPNGGGFYSEYLHRIFHQTSLLCHACQHVTEVNDNFCAACGAALTECEECHGNGQAWDDDIREWTDDPCPVCNGSGFAALRDISAAYAA